MRITIDINTNLAAFQDDPVEVQRVLLRAAGHIASGKAQEGDSYPLFDSNGNRCGWLTL